MSLAKMGQRQMLSGIESPRDAGRTLAMTSTRTRDSISPTHRRFREDMIRCLPRVPNNSASFSTMRAMTTRPLHRGICSSDLRMCDSPMTLALLIYGSSANYGNFNGESSDASVWRWSLLEAEGLLYRAPPLARCSEQGYRSSTAAQKDATYGDSNRTPQ